MQGVRGLKNALVRANHGFAIVVVLFMAMMPFLSPLSMEPNQTAGPCAGSSGGGGGPENAFTAWVYENFSELKCNSTTVAVLTIAGLNSTFCDSPHPGCLARNYDFQASVSSYVKGSGSPTIFVGDAEYPSNTLLLAGTEYVLFLSNDWTGCLPSPPAAPCALPSTPPALTFRIIGGPQGKFLVQNALVYGFRSLYPRDDSWIKVDASGVPLSQFVGTVRSS